MFTPIRMTTTFYQTTGKLHALCCLALLAPLLGSCSMHQGGIPGNYRLQKDAAIARVAPWGNSEQPTQSGQSFKSATKEVHLDVNSPGKAEETESVQTDNTAHKAPITLTDLLDSPQLKPLISEALQANPDVEQTLLALEITLKKHSQSTADLLPSLNATLAAGGGSDALSYSAGLQVSWEADIWGKLRASEHAAQKDSQEQLRLLQSARDLLAAEVAKSWLQLIGDRRAIAFQQQIVEILDTLHRSKLTRYQRGLIPLTELITTRRSLAAAKASLAEAKQTEQEEQETMRRLLGRLDNRPVEIPDKFPAVAEPVAEQPDIILARRPDMLAAYNAVEAASYRSAAAYQELLPSISLQAALDSSTTSLADLFRGDPVWSLLGQLTAPLLNRGSLRAEAEIAELESATAYAAYRDTLLTALSEVENGLSLEQSLALRQNEVAGQLNSARTTLLHNQRAYSGGLIELSDLLEARQSVVENEAEADQLQQSRLTNRIDLGLALGIGIGFDTARPGVSFGLLAVELEQ